MRKKVAALAAVSVMVIGASACSSDDDTDDPVDDSDLAPIESVLEEPVTS